MSRRTATGGRLVAPAPGSSSRHAGFAGRIVERALHRDLATVLVDQAGRLSGRGFATHTFQLARALAGHGIGSENRIALIAPNRIPTLAIRCAAGLLGAATLICPDEVTGAELAELAKGASIDTVVVFPNAAARGRPAMRATNTRMVFSYGPVDGADVDLAVAATDQPADPVTDRANPERVGVLVAACAPTAMRTASEWSFGSWARLLEGPDDLGHRELICSSLTAIGQSRIDQTLSTGGVVILRDRFDPADVFRTITAERCTHITVAEPELIELLAANVTA
jgi:hypothetical protein